MSEKFPEDRGTPSPEEVAEVVGMTQADNTALADGVLEEVQDMLGECSYPTYCKFYGDNPTFCDRSCDIPILDQI